MDTTKPTEETCFSAGGVARDPVSIQHDRDGGRTVDYSYWIELMHYNRQQYAARRRERINNRMALVFFAGSLLYIVAGVV